jgi:hypothetical protein
VDEFLFNKINGLKMCLKIRQIVEGGQKQGKIPPSRMFYAELSTETVDSFSLAPGKISLQPRRGIDAIQ